METLNAISERRSIRKFLDREIPTKTIEAILNAAIQAPSAKNRQPWKFIVVTSKEKPLMLNAMRKGIENEKSNRGLLPISAQFILGAEYTMGIMEEAPITVFVFNILRHVDLNAPVLYDSVVQEEGERTLDVARHSNKNYLWHDASMEEKFFDLANIQSIGAAIENMILAATDLGIGSLWICDIFFAYREICQWLNEETQLVAAISFGYPGENPDPRPRKKYADIVEWR